MCGKTQKKRCLIIITAIMALHILIIYFFILEYEDDRSFAACDVIDRSNEIFEANGDETADFHNGFR